MYDWSPYYRRYYSKWSPYYSKYYSKWSPYYSKYYSKWSPYYSKYYSKWSPYYSKYYSKWLPNYNRYGAYKNWSPYWYSKYRPYYRYGKYSTSPYYYNRYRPYRYNSYCNWYNYYYRAYSYYRRYFDDTYLSLKGRMDMFKTFLNSLPKNRSEMVNDLEIPEDILKDRPYQYTELEEDSLSSIRSSVSSLLAEDFKPRPTSALDTDSDISLSRAITDSEIDYDRYKRYKGRSLSDPFLQMRTALEAFPEEYLVSVNNFQETVPAPRSPSPRERRREYSDELTRSMARFFDEECRVFAPDDPAILDLEDALQNVDLKSLDLDRI